MCCDGGEHLRWPGSGSDYLDAVTRKQIGRGKIRPRDQAVDVAELKETVAAVDIPVIGCGGICTAGDAVDYFLAGAVAVQVFRQIVALVLRRYRHS